MASRPADNNQADVIARANEKLKNRRELANKSSNISAFTEAKTNIEKLGKLLEKVESENLFLADTFATLVVGLLDDRKLIICNKGNDEARAKQIAEIVLTQFKSLVPAAEKVFFSFVEEGFHAEMAIIEHLLTGMEGNQKDNLKSLTDRLQILCLGKLVCPDCAGFMNKRNIRHFSLKKNDAGAVKIHHNIGDPSRGGKWMHPRTKALFTTRTFTDKSKVAQWEVKKYSKNGKTFPAD